MIWLVTVGDLFATLPQYSSKIPEQCYSAMIRKVWVIAELEWKLLFDEIIIQDYGFS